MLLNQVKASPPQSHNVRVQIPQHCEVAGMLPQFSDRKAEYRAHKQQSLKQAELPGLMVEGQKVQPALLLSVMLKREMLFLLYMRLGSNQSFDDKSI